MPENVKKQGRAAATRNTATRESCVLSKRIFEKMSYSLSLNGIAFIRIGDIRMFAT